MVISERIKLIIDYLGENKSTFSKKIGLTNNVTIGRIVNEGRNPSYEVLKKICETYPNIDTKWLLTGEGSMILSKSSSLFDEMDKIELLNFLIDNNEELIQDVNFRKYFQMNMELLLFDEEKEKAKEAIEKLRTYKKLKNKN
ncbi:hypothetical protein SAMN04489761_3014 [Tenacibaculum sp. MAR_2009_124]|uniref:helix-turn-helix domain-containing protein n=1 Tax=Tenacibaculum sp. MAR_2009_124 TaxID=1250059 RepID=UPI00089AA626|nr:helix-turn-helix transcriptional regulator [Tenacibaculum sp. MAR_2009_124]SEC44614.1 hypothetical protein SAMN04489761_3014 [Tenacibaculum sp. MAR_2009_124]